MARGKEAGGPKAMTVHSMVDYVDRARYCYGT